MVLGKFKKIEPSPFILLPLLLLCGCSSLAMRATTAEHPPPYAGTLADIYALHDTFFGDESGNYEWPNFIGVPFVLLDLPFSAAFDTLVLPADMKKTDKGNMDCANVTSTDDEAETKLDRTGEPGSQ